MSFIFRHARINGEARLKNTVQIKRHSDSKPSRFMSPCMLHYAVPGWAIAVSDQKNPEQAVPLHLKSSCGTS